MSKNRNSAFAFSMLLGAAILCAMQAGATADEMVCPDIPEHRKVLQEGQEYYRHHSNGYGGGRSNLNPNWDTWPSAPSYSAEYVRKHGGFSGAIQAAKRWAVDKDFSSATNWESCGLLYVSEAVRPYRKNPDELFILEHDQVRAELLNAAGAIAGEAGIKMTEDSKKFGDDCREAEHAFHSAVAACGESTFGRQNYIVELASVEEALGKIPECLNCYVQALQTPDDYSAMHKAKKYGEVDKNPSLLLVQSFIDFCVDHKLESELLRRTELIVRGARAADDASPVMRVLRLDSDIPLKLSMLKMTLSDMPDGDKYDDKLIASLVPSMHDEDKQALTRSLIARCRRTVSIKRKFTHNGGFRVEEKITVTDLKVNIVNSIKPILAAYAKRGWTHDLQSVYATIGENGDLDCQIALLGFYRSERSPRLIDQQCMRVVSLIRGAPQRSEADVKESLRLLQLCTAPSIYHGSSQGERLLRSLKDELTQQLMKRQCLDVSEQLDSAGFQLETAHEYAMAEKMYRESLSILEKNLIPGDPLIADSLCNVARVCGKQGRMPMATDLFQKALKIYRAHAPGSNDQIIAALTAYGEALEEAHQKVSANVLYDQARDLMRQKAAKGL